MKTTIALLLMTLSFNILALDANSSWEDILSDDNVVAEFGVINFGGILIPVNQTCYLQDSDELRTQSKVAISETADIGPGNLGDSTEQVVGKSFLTTSMGYTKTNYTNCTQNSCDEIEVPVRINLNREVAVVAPIQNSNFDSEELFVKEYKIPNCK